MKKPLSIDAEVVTAVMALPESARAECLLALFSLPEAFGKPHAHSGLSIRKIGRITFEFRGNRALRFAFQDRPEHLRIVFLGNHNEMQRFIRSGRAI